MTAVLDDKKVKHFMWLPWMVWLVSVLFYFYEFFLNVSPNVMSNDLMRDFQVTAASIGFLGSIYLFSYSVMQIPVGALLDRYGPRYILMIAALICAVGCIQFSYASSMQSAQIARLLLGIGSAFSIVGCFKIAANWFPARRFAFIAGLTVSVGMLGAVAGEAPLAALVEHIGWRDSLYWLGIAGFIVAILIYAVIRDRPSYEIEREPTKGKKIPTRLFEGIGIVLTNPQSWYNAIYAGLMFAPSLAIAGLWGNPYLIATYHVSRTMAAGLTSLILVGWMFGSPLGGWISDRMGRRKPPMVVGSIGALICMVILLYVPNMPLNLVGTLIFFLGFFSSGFLPAFSVIKESNPEYAHGTSLGFMNTLNSIGPASAQLAIGIILDMLATHHITASMLYTATDYMKALTILPIMMVIAIGLLPFIRETYCHSEY